VQSDAWQMLSYLWLIMHDRSDRNYNQTKVKVLFDLFFQYIASATNVSVDDRKRDVSTFLTNFAIIFHEDKFWNSSSTENAVLVEKTVGICALSHPIMPVYFHVSIIDKSIVVLAWSAFDFT